MKIPPARAEAFLRAPDAAARAVLIYGPDGGLVRERVDALSRQVVPDLKDPFRVADLTPAALRDDPARLADEAAALSFTGGRRVVRLHDAGDGLAPLVQRFLDHPAGDALVVVSAGELGPRSALRKLFEGADNAAAIACYADDAAALEGVIAATLKAAGLSAEPDALAFLVRHLGGDRRLTRAELNKLVLYMGKPGRVTLADAAACVGDTADLSLDDLAMAVADGEQGLVQRVLDRLILEGVNPVAILRGVLRHFQRLHLAAGLMATGRSADQAMAALKPPVIFHQASRIRGQLQRWSLDRLGTALALLVDAEGDCKTTGLPAVEVTGRVLIQIARAAGRRR